MDVGFVRWRRSWRRLEIPSRRFILLSVSVGVWLSGWVFWGGGYCSFAWGGNVDLSAARCGDLKKRGSALIFYLMVRMLCITGRYEC